MSRMLGYNDSIQDSLYLLSELVLIYGSYSKWHECFFSVGTFLLRRKKQPEICSYFTQISIQKQRLILLINHIRHQSCTLRKLHTYFRTKQSFNKVLSSVTHSGKYPFQWAYIHSVKCFKFKNITWKNYIKTVHNTVPYSSNIPSYIL